MLPTPYVAYLRVYEPVELFPEAEKVRWRNALPNALTTLDEQRRSLQRLITGESPIFQGDGAHVLEQSGRKYISPWSTAHRCWSALTDFKSTLPKTVSDYFVSQNLEKELQNSTVEFGTRIPHIRSETWMIPPRWFALFEPHERMYGKSSSGSFVVIRTTMNNARERAIKVHKVVRGAFGTGAIEAEVLELMQWLSVFDAESIVELDYGGLADYLEQSLRANGESGLDADTSIEDVLLSIEGLSVGDGVMAGQGYERLISRWRRVASFEQAM